MNVGMLADKRRVPASWILREARSVRLNRKTETAAQLRVLVIDAPFRDDAFHALLPLHRN